jgi:hypothetical protein
MEVRMKKIIGFLMMLAMFFLSCGQREEKVEILMEDGVEVVVNRLEPYKIDGKEYSMRLEEDFVIDLEATSVSDLGLYGLDSFAVTSAGEIFLLQQTTEADHLFRFSEDGRFLLSFARNGQGPGELSMPSYITTSPEDNILVCDPINAKLVIYNNDGSLDREIILQANIPLVHPLENGLFVLFGRLRPEQEGRFLKYRLELCDQDLEFLKLLDEFQIENFAVTRRIQGTQPGVGVAFGGQRILIGNEARGYEIWVYDQEGNLVRKIRKPFHPLPVTETIKEKALARTNENARPFLFFPENLPPFRALFADQDGRLFVLTFEPAEEAGEYIIDVFDPDGVFTGRLSANIFTSLSTPLAALVREGRLYYIREKSDGFKQLVVERILHE